MSVGSKHVCAWFEFKLANGLFEDVRIELNLFAVM